MRVITAIITEEVLRSLQVPPLRELEAHLNHRLLTLIRPAILPHQQQCWLAARHLPSWKLRDGILDERLSDVPRGRATWSSMSNHEWSK